MKRLLSCAGSSFGVQNRPTINRTELCSCANVTAFQSESILYRRDALVWRRLEESLDTVTVDG